MLSQNPTKHVDRANASKYGRWYVCLSVCIIVCLSVCLSVLRSICLPICLSISSRQASSVICRFVGCLSVCLSAAFLCVGLSFCLLVCRSVRSVDLSVVAFVNTELRLCARIGRWCPRWSCPSRIRTTACPRRTSYFSLFRETHSQSHPHLLKYLKYMRFFKYWSDLVPNNAIPSYTHYLSYI